MELQCPPSLYHPYIPPSNPSPCLSAEFMELQCPPSLYHPYITPSNPSPCLSAEFMELQVEEIAKEVDMLFKDCFSLNKKLGSKISELLRDKVSEFKTLVPTVLDLGNPNMKVS